MFKFAKGALNTIIFKRPINARLWLTYRCNYKCEMCSIHKIDKREEMSLPEIARAAVNLKKIGLSQVILTGGEPLLRQDIVEIIKIFKPYDFLIRIQTSGAMHVTEDLIDQCYEAGLNDISVSLDTLDFDKQDIICGANEVAQNALRILTHCQGNYSDQGIIAANIVISRKNFFELPKVIKFVDEMGVFINPCIYVRKFSAESKPGEDKLPDDFSLVGLDSHKVDQTIDEIKDMIRHNRRILMSSRIIEDLRHYMKTGEYKWSCAGGVLSFDVVPTGEVVPCCDTIDTALKEPVANLKDENFVQVYQSEAFQAKLRDRREGCPGCLYACYRDPVYLAYDPSVQFEALLKSIKFKKIFK